MGYRIVIPTAGIGSRLKEFTRYINKSLVGIANRPTISHLIEQFPQDCEFVIAHCPTQFKSAPSSMSINQKKQTELFNVFDHSFSVEDMILMTAKLNDLYLVFPFDQTYCTVKAIWWISRFILNKI